MDSIENNEQREMIREFEKAHAIAQLIRQPGFKFLMEILEKELERDKLRLLTLPQGTEPHIVNSCLLAAQISRSKFESLQLRLNSMLDFTSAIQNNSEY